MQHHVNDIQSRRPPQQEHVAQPFEDVLPYEAFSIRLSNDDLPLVREILRGVTDAQYRQLLEVREGGTVGACVASDGQLECGRGAG